jgi:Arylsulfotransferase (ASST)
MIRRRVSRRRFLQASGLGIAGLAVGGAGFTVSQIVGPIGGSSGGGGGGDQGPPRFQSRPDLNPPVITMKKTGPTSPGYIFLTPGNGVGSLGPTIIDETGEPIWVRPDNGQQATNLKVWDYGGRPVMAWWEGQIIVGYGHGTYILMDQSYQQVAEVHAQNGYFGDLHEFVLTPRGTGLMSIFGDATGQVFTTRGPGLDKIVEGVVQEVDVASGRLLFEWRSSQHVATKESYLDIPRDPSTPYDYFHINSIDETADGGLIVSARHTWCVYKIHRPTGNVEWRLNGKQSDFEMGEGTRFAWQHDARSYPDGSISIFDDGAAHGTPFEARSRAILLRADASTGKATLERAYSHPGILATSQGSVQELPDGHTFVGWGNVPHFTEWGADGTMVLDGSYPGGGSYRSYRFPWTGRPLAPPDVAVVANGGGTYTVYASWNGATDVDGWRLMAGESTDQLTMIDSSPRGGFETAMVTRTTEPWVAVQAVDAQGQVMGISKPAPVSGP